MLFADNIQRHIYTGCKIVQLWWWPLPLLPAVLFPFAFANPSFYLHTWRTSFSCLWCEYPSTLVPDLLSTVLPLLFHPPQGTPEIKLLHRRHQQHRHPMWYTTEPKWKFCRVNRTSGKISEAYSTCSKFNVVHRNRNNFWRGLQPNFVKPTGPAIK